VLGLLIRIVRLMTDNKREENDVYWNPENSILSCCCLHKPLPFGINPMEGLGICSKCMEVTEFYCIPQILEYIREGEEAVWYGPDK